MVTVVMSDTGSIEAETTHYKLRSPLKTDATLLFEKIFNDQKVMEMYAAGQKEPLQSVQEKRINRAVLRSQSLDPWHMLMVFEKNRPESKESFIGFVVAGHGEKDPSKYGLPKTDSRKFSEIAIAIVHEKQRQGAGKELIDAICTIAQKALEFVRANGMESLAFDTLIATAAPDHPAISIFKGFKKELIYQKPFTDKLNHTQVHKPRVVFTKEIS